MFFVDKPYVSDIFKKTVRDNGIPVVGTDIAKRSGLPSGTNIISEDKAVALAREQNDLAIYTLSENSLDWISKHLSFTELPAKIGLFKDKLKFRKLTGSMLPDFYFKEVRFEDLRKVRIQDVPLPFIIKPTVGFFSLGVYKVNHLDEWSRTIDLLTDEIEQKKELFPRTVFDTGSFIIEQYIEGEEFAIDAYFDSVGEPVILSIFKHAFSSENDVSDRVYISSRDIIEEHLDEFTNFLARIGRLAGVKTFPVHVELRRNADGALLPIEVNPMRFGGWCTTADVTYLGFGFDPYLYYYTQQKPDWTEILRDKAGKLYSIIVLDNSTGLDADKIASFNYDKLVSGFECPLELRKIDFKVHPLFGFLFTETRADNFRELEKILHSDLNEFVSKKTTS